MNKIIIIGAGGHGKVAAEIAELNHYTDISFVDDKYPSHSRVKKWKIKKSLASCIKNIEINADYFVAIGDNNKRIEVLNLLKKQHANIVSLIHPESSLSSYSKIGIGTLIAAKSVVAPFCTIDEGCILNTSSSIDHDCILQQGVHICPGVNLAGNVKVCSKSLIGTGSNIQQNIHIGSNVIVGSGAAVIADIEDNNTVVGVPAKVIKKNEQ